MLKERLIAFVVGLIVAAIIMRVIPLVEDYVINTPISEFIQGIIFASAFLAGRQTIVEHFKEKHNDSKSI